MSTTLEVIKMAGERINQNLDEAVAGSKDAYERILTSLAVIRIEVGKAEKSDEAEKFL